MANHANDSADRLPFFYAEKEHDTITAEDWLNRAIALQQSANWPPVKAVNECRLALRGMASEWYMGLALDQAECYVNFNLFIAAFKKFTEITDKPEDLIAQTAELKQKANEKVTIFYVRCRRAIMKHLQAASMNPLPAELQDEELEQFRPGIREQIQQLQQETHKQAFFHVLLTWFLAGLKPEIRGRVLDKRCQTHEEAHDEAVSIEMALESQKGIIQKTPVVFEVQQRVAGTSENTAQAMYVPQGGRGRGRGRGNSRGRGGRGQSGTSSRGRRQSVGIAPANTNNRGPVPYQNGQRIPADTCAYCRKKGHWQKECRKRLNESGRLIKIFAVNQHEDQFGDPRHDQMKQDPPHQNANMPLAYDDASSSRGPPPGYPFPDPAVQAQQAMVNLQLPYLNNAGNE